MEPLKSKLQASNFTRVNCLYFILLILYIPFVIMIDNKLISHLDDALDIVLDSQRAGRSNKSL